VNQKKSINFMNERNDRKKKQNEKKAKKPILIICWRNRKKKIGKNAKFSFYFNFPFVVCVVAAPHTM